MGHISNYPDPDAKRLRLTIAERNAISPDSVVCGNGSTELIYLMVRALRPGTVLVRRRPSRNMRGPAKSRVSGM